MEWMDELEKAVRRAPEREEPEEMDETDAEGNGVDGAEPPPMKKSAGEYVPSDNGDDEDEEGGAAVRDGEAMESANNNPGKKQKLFPKNKGGVKKSLAPETQDAIEVSDVLTDLTKGIERVADGQAHEIQALKSEIAGLTKGLRVIGQALVKSLEETRQLAKSLAMEVEDLGRQPAARKSSVRRLDKSFVGSPNTPALPTKEQRMEKSMAAIKAGRIGPIEASIFETESNRGNFRQDIWKKMGGE